MHGAVATSFPDLRILKLIAISSNLIPGEVGNRLEEEVFSIAYDIELARDVVFGIIVFSNDFWKSGLASVMTLYKNIEREGIMV